MAWEIWLENCCCFFMGYSLQSATRDLLYALFHREDGIYHVLCYTGCEALVGMKSSSMGPSIGISPMIHHIISRCTCSFIVYWGCLILQYVHSFIHSFYFISFIHLFIYLFIYSFIHSFIYLFILYRQRDSRHLNQWRVTVKILLMMNRSQLSPSSQVILGWVVLIYKEQFVH